MTGAARITAISGRRPRAQAQGRFLFRGRGRPYTHARSRAPGRLDLVLECGFHALNVTSEDRQ
jgi:hypothetical protein